MQAEIDAHPPTSNNELKQNWRNLLEAERELQLQYSALRREVNLRYRRLDSISETEELKGQFKKQRGDFLDNSRELRELADKINESYNALSHDDAVKKSLSSLKLSTKEAVGLAPRLTSRKRTPG